MNYIVFDGSKDQSCAKCRFKNDEICVVTGEKRLYQICPIRTLPERKGIEKDKDERVELIGIGYALGWNTCLEEIEK